MGTPIITKLFPLDWDKARPPIVADGSPQCRDGWKNGLRANTRNQSFLRGLEGGVPGAGSLVRLQFQILHDHWRFDACMHPKVRPSLRGIRSTGCRRTAASERTRLHKCGATAGRRWRDPSKLPILHIRGRRGRAWNRYDLRWNGDSKLFLLARQLCQPLFAIVSRRQVVARWWIRLARTCHSQKWVHDLFFKSCSSGGGLPGRPVTRKSRTPVF